MITKRIGLNVIVFFSLMALLIYLGMTKFVFSET